MTFLEKIYLKVSAIKQISGDDFSKEFLGVSSSYYRSMKSRNIDASTGVLVTLMERLGQRAQAMRSGKAEPFLMLVGDKYEALAVEVGHEIARRSLHQCQHSQWVKQTLLKIVNEINSDRHDQNDQENWSVPPIIIC
jgi:hypothetical protein